MSNGLYIKAKKSLLEGLFDLTDNAMKVVLLKDTYSVNINTHEFLSDIPEASVAATTDLLTSKSTESGIFDADNITIENYGTSGFSSLVIYKDTGSRSTSRLLAYIDTAAGLPVPATPAPISITISWSNEQYKIFSL